MVVRLRQSPPSKSHAVLLHAASQNLSPIQLEGHPSAQLGTGHDKYTCHGMSATPNLCTSPCQTPHLLPAAVRVKVLGPDMVAKHDIIVKVDKLAGQAGDAVQMRLDGRRAVGVPPPTPVSSRTDVLVPLSA